MIIYLLQVTCCSIVFLLIYQYLLRKDTFFLRNRIYLLLAPVLSFVLPLFQWDLSFFTKDSIAGIASTILLEQVQVYGFEPNENTIQYEMWLAWIAIIGSVLYLAYTSLGLLKISNLLEKSPKKYLPEYTLVELDSNQEPFSFMSYLFWGKTSKLSEAEKQIIIRHELAHIKGNHSYDILYMELLCGLCWFIPLFFIYKNLLKELHEFIADADASQSSGTKNYTNLMVRNTLNSLNLNLSHNFYQSPIIKRLEMMNKKRTPIVKHVKLLMIAPVITLLSFMFSCEGNQDEAGFPAEEITEKKSLEIDTSGEIFEIAETAAEPIGGYAEFYTYVKESLVYPEQAKRIGVEGKVYVQFVVNTDGSLSDITVIRGIGAGCDAAAKKILENAPNFNPAERAGKYVKQRIVLPINFKLG